MQQEATLDELCCRGAEDCWAEEMEEDVTIVLAPIMSAYLSLDELGTSSEAGTSSWALTESCFRLTCHWEVVLSQE